MKLSMKNVLAIGTVLMVASGAAAAQSTVDVTAATGAFTATADAVNDVGPLMLTAVAAGIVYKWVVAFLI